MSKFRVGQRVRVKYAASDHGQKFVGCVGLIEKIEREPHWQWDAYGLDIAPIIRVGGEIKAWSDDQLEPATDCYDKTEWSECVWMPEHLRVGA